MDLSQSQWANQLAEDSNAVIVDVRTPLEVNDGYIPNAVNIDILNPSEFMMKAQELDTSKNYYIYCKSGGRSGQACAILGSMGINNTYNLLGGFTEWEGAITS